MVNSGRIIIVAELLLLFVRMDQTMCHSIISQ